MDIAIIGGGPAGLAAGIYTSRAQLDTIIFEKGVLGGQIALSAEVENYPGFESISGGELIDKFVFQAEKFGSKIINEEVESITKTEEGFTIKTNEQEHTARSVIIATGATAKMLGVNGESEYYGRGVSTCATCDGFFFRDKEVVVVGGGDAAVEEGLFLTKFCSKVTIIHRRDELRASKILQERAFNNDKIEFVFNTEVQEIIGDGEVITNVLVRNKETQNEYTIPANGVFVFIGHYPNTSFLVDLVNMNHEGYIEVADVQTSEEGVFACGDSSDPIYRQVATSVGSGVRAAMAAERWISHG